MDVDAFLDHRETKRKQMQIRMNLFCKQKNTVVIRLKVLNDSSSSHGKRICVFQLKIRSLTHDPMHVVIIGSSHIIVTTISGLVIVFKGSLKFDLLV